MAQQSTLIQVRVDENIKKQADALFSDLGFDTPTAIRIFLNQAIRREGMPFEVAKPQPNVETLATMERIPKQYNNFKEILMEIDEEIETERVNFADNTTVMEVGESIIKRHLKAFKELAE